MTPTSDCDCGHPRDDHDDDGPCLTHGCGCAYYDGCDVIRMVHLVETDEGW